MSRKSKRKGASFERQVAKMFAEALGIDIRRTPMSGGWAQGKDVQGDLVCVEPGPEAFPYCVECKNQEGWRLESLFTDDHAWFDNWWKQLWKECPKDRTPLLVFSRAYAPIFASCPMDIFLIQNGPNPCIEWSIPYITLRLAKRKGHNCYVAVMALDDFIRILL